MSSSNNYYTFMGIHKSADIEVIKTVYRVLAKKYHPDHYKGPKEKAEYLFRTLNKAFTVLSHKDKRKKYDQTLNEGLDSSYSYEEKDSNEDEGFNASNYDPSLCSSWLVAERVYPEINKCREKLAQLNSTLAIAYTSYLVEHKAFSNALSLSNEFQEMFLSTYFGKDKAIQKLAFQLIIQGFKSLAVDLNKIIKVIGIPDKTNGIIDKFLSIHNLSKDAYWSNAKIIKNIDFEKSYNKIINEKYDLKKTSDGFYGRFK